MYYSQEPYRELWGALLEHQTGSVFEDLLVPWSQSNTDEKTWLIEFSSRQGSPIPQASPEDICRLYALSRVNEILLLRFQHGRADGSDYPGPEISVGEYVAFLESLGLKVTEQVFFEPFSHEFEPFSHEIVEVEQSDDPETPIAVISEFWPSLMLGEMMFSRAGVGVRGGTRHVRKEIAETSTIYWAYRRKNRPYEDLSQGWGSNSQWRTSVRRDYRYSSTLYFNVDGEHFIGSASDEHDSNNLNEDERIELLLNRCLITVNKPHGDLCPYDDKYQTMLHAS